MHWLSDNNNLPQGVISSWEESDLHCNGFVDGDDGDLDDDTAGTNSQNDHVKGEHLTQDDRDHEEELMASIMANGNQIKKDQYLNKSHDEKNQKGKKKFNFFSDQTRSAFQDIKLMYSSFFGHGWNLSRAEFWRGFHIVEQFYARNPTYVFPPSPLFLLRLLQLLLTSFVFELLAIVLLRTMHLITLRSWSTLAILFAWLLHLMAPCLGSTLVTASKLRLSVSSNVGFCVWTHGYLVLIRWFLYPLFRSQKDFIRFNSDRKNVMDYFKLKKEDMIVWHFDKRTALVPSYYIVRDPKYNALCIIIRGTFVCIYFSFLFVCSFLRNCAF